jgi:hypothetical protein
MFISMGERGRGLRFWALAAFQGAILGSCAGDTPASELEPPDLLKISVFYPVDGLVRGRGLAGTINSPRATHVRIASHPTKGETIVPVQMDGSFTFSVIAISDDLLEISAATDDKATERGEPVYLVVPPTPLPPPKYICCGARDGRNGTCQDEDSAAAGNPCPDAATGTEQCQTDRECGVQSGELIMLDVSRFQITPPDQEGRISVAGTVQANMLVTLENRGQSAVGGYKPTQRRQVRITDDSGNFVFDSVVARGDDELVFQLHDLLGFRSPEGSVLVPDAPVTGVDIVGAFAYETLTPEQRGPIAFLISPFGVDGRGICPDSTNNPILCLSGGLTYDMVNLLNVRIDTFDVQPTPSSTTAQRPHTRGLLGGDDPLAGPQDIVVVLDISSDTEMVDTEPRRFDDLREFVRGLRSRDHVALVTYGSTIEAKTPLLPPEQRGTLLNEIDALKNVDAAGMATPFQAVSFAAELLAQARTRRPGRIVLVTLSEPAGNLDEATAEFDVAFDKVRPNPSLGFDGWKVDVVAVALDPSSETLTLLSDMAAFSAGEFYSVLTLNSLNQTLADLRTALSGSFILLYDLLIPKDVGKQGTISFTAEILLPGSERVQSMYSGPLTITNGR